MAQKPYAAMQALIRDQSAMVAAMREAAENIRVASTELAQNAPQEINPNIANYRAGQPARSGGVNGDRPKMKEKQTYRPVHSETGSAGVGFGGIRSRVADAVHSTFGAGGGSRFDRIYDSEGNHTGYREVTPEGVKKVHDKDAPGISQAIRQAGVRAGISRVANAAGEGGILSATRAVPIVGTAIAAAEALHGGLGQIASQRQANAQYQSIYGGTNLGTGLSNRAQATGFGLSQLFQGGMTTSQSAEAFHGVSSLGFQGAQRSSDLSFISQNYKSLGMGVKESLDLIATASKNLNTNLSGLKDGLKSVSDAARETGQNAGAARAVFGQTYAKISQAAPGVAAGPISSALSTMQTSLGRSMQGLDFSGALTTQGGQAQLANLSGQTISQFRSTELTDPSKALGSLDTLMAQIVAPFLTSDVQNAINQQVSQIPGGKAAVSKNPDVITQKITPVILQMVNSDALAAAFARVPGLQVDPVRAVTLMIEQYLGIAGNATQQYQSQQATKQQNTKALPKGADQSALATANGNTEIATPDPSKKSGMKYQKVSAIKGLNPVLDDAKSQLKGQNIIVDTKGGKRVVSIDEAIRAYSDQIAKGTATVADTGETVKDTLGESETNYQGLDTTTGYKASKGQTDKKSGLKSDRGMSVEAYNAMQKKGGKSGGTVTIQPSKELQQLLSFSATGNIAIANGGAATGTQPVPGQVGS